MAKNNYIIKEKTVTVFEVIDTDTNQVVWDFNNKHDAVEFAEITAQVLKQQELKKKSLSVNPERHQAL
jgi:hypothetical protein